MKDLGITISGNRYEVSLDERLERFVRKDLQEIGIALNQDNKADKLLQAYLELAKEHLKIEEELNELVNKLEESSIYRF